MKAEELMIGDWVRVKAPYFKKNKAYRVVEVREHGYNGEATVNIELPDEDEEASMTGEFLFGIPITQEILEKNGFVMDERYGVAVRYSFATDLHKPKQTVIQFTFYDGGVSADTLFKCWTSPKDFDGINDLHICDLKFVHELQHALRLCGIEKEIEL